MSYTDSFVESNIRAKRCQIRCIEVGATQHTATPLWGKTGVVTFL